VYHRKEKGLSKFPDEGFEDHQPFPTLEQSLKTVTDSCGFNVEIKWTMQLACGTYELLHPFELNRFLDLILKVVLEHGGRRKIVFSSFHPDICSMLRLKQNRYPVLFLTQGVSEIWPAYDDYRCQGIRQAVFYATSADILGINLHTEDLLRDPTQMDLALKHNLIVFCWGEHNNNRSTIAYLKSLGMHGIIYDKIDVYNDKEEKKSIFLCEEHDSIGNHSSLTESEPSTDKSCLASKSENSSSSVPGPSSRTSASQSAAVAEGT
ncbi:Glycerophosphodiester phosphodiesterase domain, partial [Trinorchestia longiramus]